MKTRTGLPLAERLNRALEVGIAAERGEQTVLTRAVEILDAPSDRVSVSEKDAKERAGRR